MRKFLTTVLVLAALMPTAAIANHEVPDPQPTVRFALERAYNNAPVRVFTWLHLDRAAGTWTMDCTSPAGSGSPYCPFVLTGTLDLDPHYGPLSDPGCSIPRGFDGAGSVSIDPLNTTPLGIEPIHYEPADLSDVRFGRTPVTPATPGPRISALFLEGQWSDSHGRADRMEAVFTTFGGALPPMDVCGTGDVAHLFLDGYVWLMGVVR